MVNKNPPIYINGTVPYLGSRLSVQWGPFVAILVCIVATHFVVFALTYILAVKELGVTFGGSVWEILQPQASLSDGR